MTGTRARPEPQAVNYPTPEAYIAACDKWQAEEDAAENYPTPAGLAAYARRQLAALDDYPAGPDRDYMRRRLLDTLALLEEQ